MAIHKTHYKNYLDESHYCTSFKIIKYPDAYIELLEQYPCNSREELNRREGSYIRKINCVNKNIAGRTKKQYRIDNADVIKKKTFCTVCCGSYTYVHKARHMKTKKHNDICLNKLFKLP
jgi:hypothetical protein